MATTYFYIDDYTDEVLPCLPTLADWAEWLAADVWGDWNREGPIVDGSEFIASRMTDLGTIAVVQLDDDSWSVAGDGRIPDGTTTFFRRDHILDSGWDADFGGNTIADALTDWDESDAYLACVRENASVRVRFEAAGPRIVVLGEVA